jgi:WD40 repeat protein
VGAGTAIVTLSFDAWKEGRVRPTTHKITVLPPKAGPKTEPISPLLSATLVHSERTASITQLKYSADGKKLFVAGYPSGLVQIFDVESRKELQRIETPKGYRGTANYALLSPDWKTLYTWNENARKVVPVETNGKKDYRIEYSGHILAWDLATGKPIDGFAPERDCGFIFAKMTDDGTRLVCVEVRSGLASNRHEEKRTTYVLDLKTGRKSKLGDGYLFPHFHPDGKTIYATDNNYPTKTSVLKRIDLTTGKELAKFDSPVKGLMFSVADVSPDGKLLAVSLGGVRGTKPTILFLNAMTLEEVDRFTGEPEPNNLGWVSGKFLRNGKYFLSSGSSKHDKFHIYHLGEKKVVRTIAMDTLQYHRWEISPDGRWLAVAWMPKWDESVENSMDPDPLDLPQPRVTLYNLKDEKAQPITLIAPHGYLGSLAFRPDGKQLAFGSSGGVHLFDLAKLE